MHPLMDCSLYHYLEEDLHEKTKQISDATKWGWIFKIARGIQFMHEKNYWHRDIKGLNILVHS